MIPYDKRSGKIWYNNELVDWADAKIHILNVGLHYASCVFEGERVYNGSIFIAKFIIRWTKYLYNDEGKLDFKYMEKPQSIHLSREFYPYWNGIEAAGLEEFFA